MQVGAKTNTKKGAEKEERFVCFFWGSEEREGRRERERKVPMLHAYRLPATTAVMIPSV